MPNSEAPVPVVPPINASETERKTFEDGFESMNGGYSGMFENLDEYLKTLS